MPSSSHYPDWAPAEVIEVYERKRLILERLKRDRPDVSLAALQYIERQVEVYGALVSNLQMKETWEKLVSLADQRRLAVKVGDGTADFASAVSHALLPLSPFEQLQTPKGGRNPKKTIDSKLKKNLSDAAVILSEYELSGMLVDSIRRDVELPKKKGSQLSLSVADFLWLLVADLERSPLHQRCLLRKPGQGDNSLEYFIRSLWLYVNSRYALSLYDVIAATAKEFFPGVDLDKEEVREKVRRMPRK